MDPRNGEAPGRASAPAQSDGKKSEYSPRLRSVDEQDQGSVIIVLATDIPLSERQLARVSRRAVVGLARTGSYLGHGSGDIAVTFTTANRITENAPEDGSETVTYTRIHDSVLDRIFACTAEVTEEAVVSSLWHAETVEGRKYPYVGLREYLEKQRGTGGF